MKKHPDLWHRIVANTEDPENEQGCWVWTGRVSKSYPRMNIRRNGKHVTIRPYRAILVLLELRGEDDLFWDLYDLYSVARLDPDHLCYRNPRCVNPDHLEWTTQEKNASLSQTRVHPDSPIWRNYRAQA